MFQQLGKIAGAGATRFFGLPVDVMLMAARENRFITQHFAPIMPVVRLRVVLDEFEGIRGGT